MATTHAPAEELPPAPATPTPADADGGTTRPGPARAASGGLRRLLRAHPDLIPLLALTIIAALPRLVLQFGAPIFYFPDSTGYLEPAYDLVTGQGFSTRLKRPAGYPLLIAGTFALFGPHLLAVAAVQHVIGLVSVGLTYLLGKICFGRWVGFGAGLLVALAGPLLTYEHSALTESPFVPLLLGITLTLIAATRATSHRPAILAGVLLGVASLFRPVAESLFPLALLLVALRPGTRRQRLASAGLLAAAVAVVILPWMARNFVIHGRFSLGGALGESLLARTLQYSRGEFVFDSPHLPPDPDPLRAAARRIIQDGVGSGATSGGVREQMRVQLGLNEVESDRLLQQITLDVIRRQPLTFAINSLESVISIYRTDERSLPLLWNSRYAWESHPTLSTLIEPPAAAQEAARGLPEAMLQLYRPSRFGLALPAAALLGLLAAWRWRPLAPAVVVGLLNFYLLAVHVTLDGPVPRYRYATEPLLSVLALGAVWTALRAAAAGPGATSITRSRAVPAVALLGVGLLVVAPRVWGLDRFDPSIFGNEYDEGIRLEQLYLMAAGFRPFREIYASQGPLLLDFFYPFFNAFGRSVLAARVPVLLSSLLALAATYLVARQLGGRLSGLAAVALLGLSTEFLSVSRLALAEVPSMAPTCLALWLALAFRADRRPLLLHLSAISYAVGILLKPMAALALVPIALALAPAFWRPAAGWRRFVPTDLVQWGLTAAATCGLVVLVLGPGVLYEQFVSYRQGAVGLGALGTARWSLGGNWQQIRLELRDDLLLVALACAAIWPLVRAAPFFATVALSWAMANLVMLLFYSPLAEKHIAYLMPPLALLAGGGIGAAARLLEPGRTRWRIAATVPLGLILAWYLLTAESTVRAAWRLTTPNVATLAPEQDFVDALGLVAAVTGPGDYLVTDHPYLAYLADRPLPPRLVDTSRTRILSRSLTAQEAILHTREVQPRAIVYWAGRLQLLPQYAAWLETQYTLIRMYDHNRAIYIRNDTLASLPEAMPPATAEQFAVFGDVLALTGREVERFGSGRDTRVALRWRALQPIPPETWVVHLELVSADGSTFMHRDDRVLPPWRSAPLPLGAEVVHRRWLDLDEIEAGEYHLVAYVTPGRNGAPLAVAAADRHALGSGVATAILLGRVVLK